MSIIAGIFLKDREARVAEPESASLKKWLAEAAGAEPVMHASGAVCFAKVDFGIYPDRAWRAAPGGDFAMLAGWPVLEEPDTLDRSVDLRVLSEAVSAGNDRPLARARGSYCAAFLDAKAHALHLVADKAALRPLYYHEDPRRVVFSTSLKVMEGLDFVPKRMDMRGVVELTTWGVPLADRTAYADIRTVRAGHRIRFDAAGSRPTAYWRWEDVDTSPLPVEEMRERAVTALRQAVVRRLGKDRSVFSFLSGGLDSRAVAAFLREQGREVHTFNFAPGGTLDAVLGEQFAAKVGTRHLAEPIPPGSPLTFLQMLRRSIDGHGAFHPAPERPGLIWDGGGTGTTLVMHRITDKAVGLFRQGRQREGVQDILDFNNMNLSPRIFSAAAYRKLSGLLMESVLEEMGKVKTGDPVRDFQVFMIHSYEGKHYHGLFEDLGDYRMELVQPFFDWNYVETCFHIPAEQCMWHRFYIPMLPNFPPAVSQVPWQAYPEAPPCPLPLPDFPNQWSKDNPYQVADSAKWKNLAWGLLSKRNFADPFLRKGFLTWSVLAHAAGIRDYRYVFKAWSRFSRHHAVSAGRYLEP